MASLHQTNKFYLLFRKDLALFFDTFVSLSSAFGFAFLSVLVATFTLGAVILPEHDRVILAHAANWLCFVFSVVYIFTKTIEAERLHEALDMILLSRISPATFYFAKWLSTTLVVWLMQILICLLFEIFFAANFLKNIFPLALVFLLSSSAITSTGILFSAMSSYLRNKEISLPIIIFPLSIPVLFSGVELSMSLSIYQNLDVFWLSVLLAINAISLSVSWLLFERVVRG